MSGLLHDALDGIHKALYGLPVSMRSMDAARQLIAIAGQESAFLTRQQEGGPAHGFWQMEIEAVQNLFVHHETKDLLIPRCLDLGIKPTVRAVYDGLLQNDILAATCARLSLWLDPNPLPTTQQEGWVCYLRVWRPGKPRPEAWPGWWHTGTQSMAEAARAPVHKSLLSRLSDLFHPEYHAPQAAHSVYVAAAPTNHPAHQTPPKENTMAYIPLILSIVKIIEPLYEDFKAAVAEGKSNDPATLKTQKLLTDVEDAIKTLISAL